MPHVLDANCWAAFVSEDLKKTPSFGKRAFERAAEEGKIAFDNGGLMFHQYNSCRPGHDGVFDGYFENLTMSGKVKIVNIDGLDNCRAILLSLGLPQAEHIYFRVAIHGAASVIVSDDIDFFDPKQKAAKAPQRQRCKAAGNGPVCKFMRREHDIEIVWLENFGVP